ncbi:ABC-type branched-subunit amino acid transport system substrate-binding protein [Variovorax boronicumulans]|uniref:branched-chain amino acid ABC transporter substrate-binding protein n=1 Tax=Variovorax TaxID=34072 RepID=UPI00277D3407|nr:MULTISPECIES: branched-chain amino acid ABC transporter substrate-binding protein [Variovorax]MDP9994750.1 ABC-type branched-subunit amino acid transport system substrate-binding protein [Variovorax boronicumulans]MDQ0005908.1 ABC-type branched-subunit amino acid transport system substrate-binding protein [Variovorax boronicumulans]MDQ0037189.1 ABC-type branched-subunit amino acid transport system substrate-binding protein [Variovorax boronicumulans]MDQ0612329.1 branched-chain amino acid tra
MKFKKAPSARIALACLLCIAGAANAQQPTYKIAYIDPLSGPFANVGELMLMHTQYAIEDINAKGGVLGGTKLQLLQFDSKLSAQESQSALQAAIDQGAKAIVTGGSGSSVVTALVQSVARWNQRNPGKELIVLNHSSIDPEMTGKGCSFWHFQTEANTAMKMKALANYIKKTPDVKKVYLLNQDYAHGKQWASYGRQMVGLARPDVQFVGEALHPIGRVKDFAPYIANIRQSGADSVITGNWGQDMTLLLKAAGDAGYNLRYFNHSAGSVPGTVTAVSQAKTGQLTWVAEWHPGQADTPKADALAKAYKAKTGKDFLAPRIDMTPRLLALAINKAGSADTVKVARALEDLSFDSVVGTVRMRAEDHQLLLPQVVNTIAPVDGKAVKVGWEGTNYGFRTDAVYSGNELAQGTECKMVRP